MTNPNQTTGIGCKSRVIITSNAPQLVLVGSEQNLTAQLAVEVTDNFSNVIPDVEVYYSTSDPSVATISDSGLVTAHEAGNCTVEASIAAFGQSPTVLGPDGTPVNGKVYQLQTVTVLPGVPELADFSLTLDSDSYSIDSTGTATITATVAPLHGFTGDVAIVLGTNYRIYPPTDGPDQPFPIIGYQAPATIAATYTKDGLIGSTGFVVGGSGVCTITLTATDAPVGTIPLIVNGSYPIFNNAINNTGPQGGPARSHVISATLTVTE